MPKSKKALRSGIVAWPNLEANFTKWVREQQSKGIAIAAMQIHLQVQIT